MRFDSRYDLFDLISDLYLGAKQLFRFLHFLAGNDLTHLELKFFKVLKGNLRLWLQIDSLLCFPGAIVSICF